MKQKKKKKRKETERNGKIDWWNKLVYCIHLYTLLYTCILYFDAIRTTNCNGFHKIHIWNGYQNHVHVHWCIAIASVWCFFFFFFYCHLDCDTHFSDTTRILWSKIAQITNEIIVCAMVFDIWFVQFCLGCSWFHTDHTVSQVW